MVETGQALAGSNTRQGLWAALVRHDIYQRTLVAHSVRPDAWGTIPRAPTFQTVWPLSYAVVRLDKKRTGRGNDSQPILTAVPMGRSVSAIARPRAVSPARPAARRFCVRRAKAHESFIRQTPDVDGRQLPTNAARVRSRVSIHVAASVFRTSSFWAARRRPITSGSALAERPI